MGFPGVQTDRVVIDLITILINITINITVNITIIITIHINILINTHKEVKGKICRCYLDSFS